MHGLHGDTHIHTVLTASFRVSSLSKNTQLIYFVKSYLAFNMQISAEMNIIVWLNVRRPARRSIWGLIFFIFHGYLFVQKFCEIPLCFHMWKIQLTYIHVTY